MTIRSEPTKAERKGTGIIKRTQAAALLRFLARVVALVLLYGSWLGTSLLVAGTIPSPWWQLWQLPTSAIAVGFAVQAPITLAEFANRHRRGRVGYWAPFLVDTLTTFLGYRAIVVPWLVSGLSSDGTLAAAASQVGPIVAAYIVMIIFSAFVACFPELVLVDD